MSITFQELAGSPREWYGPDGPRAERRILVAWNDRHEMIRLLLGEGYAFGGAPPTAYPGYDQVVAMRAAVEPFNPVPDDGTFTDVATDINTYAGRPALITIDYELIEPADDDMPDHEADTFLTYRLDFGVETLTLAGASAGLKWESDSTLPVPPSCEPRLRIPVVEHHVTWHRVWNPPWAAIRAAIGRVNQTEIFSAPAGTLLFDGCRADKEFVGFDSLAQPELCWRISYIFRERKINDLASQTTYGWQHSWRPLPAGTAGFDRLLRGNDPIYNQADFSSLFQFAAT